MKITIIFAFLVFLIGAVTARSCVCTKEYNPMCGRNGITYSNPCLLKGAGVKLKHKGPC